MKKIFVSALSTLALTDAVVLGFNSEAKAVLPETYLTIRLNGVEMNRLGGFAMYRVFRMWQESDGTIPIGTARVRLQGKT